MTNYSINCSLILMVFHTSKYAFPTCTPDVSALRESSFIELGPDEIYQKGKYISIAWPFKQTQQRWFNQCDGWLTAPTSFRAAVIEMAGVVGLEEGVALEASSWGVESDGWVAGAAGGGAPPTAPTATFNPRAASCYVTKDRTKQKAQTT